MKMRYAAAVLGLASGLSSGMVHAAPITYDLTSENVGGIVTSGTITTDGTLGVLNTGNISAFNIVLTQSGFGSLALTNTTASEMIVGDYLTATATGLNWNYAGGTGAEFSIVTNFQPNTSAQFHLYTNRTDVDFSTVEHFAYHSGVAQIASVSAVPLPAAAPLFGASLLVLAGFGYGLKHRASAKNSKAATV